jgi:membrane protein involved in colicin uptake
VVKIALVFIALFSGSAMAQYTGGYGSGGYVRFVDSHCQYEWTAQCDQQAMEEERFYRSQMLEQAQEQNEILKENQRLQKRQLREQEEQRNQEEMWRLMHQ